MPLINKLDDTKLRSIGYGKDKPYITTDVVTGKIDTGKVPLVDTILNVIPKQVNVLGTKIDIKNSRPVSGIIDASRIGNFLLDLSKGPEFTVKQIALQKMNTIPNGGNSTITSNPFAGSTSFFGRIGSAVVNTVNKLAPYPGQLYSPTNTVAQVALQGVGLHIGRAGLFPVLDVPKYENFFGDRGKTYKDTNSNVLKLYEKKPLIVPKALSKVSSILSKIPILKRAIPLPSLEGDVLYTYQGGPESLGGLGTTRIRRAEIRKGIYTLTDSINNSELNGFNIQSESDFRKLSNDSKGRLKDKAVDVSTVVNPRVPFNLLKPATNNVSATSGLTIYNPLKDNKLVYKNYLGETLSIKTNGGLQNAAREIRVGSGRKDAINLTPLFTGTTASNNSLVKIGGSTYNIRDLIKFRIETVDNNSNGTSSIFMIFRSYLTDFSDNITGDWNNFKYVGRGENLYTYSGFNRSVSIGFKVAALSSDEMKPMYQKLNFLASSMMPDYTGGYMKGNFFRMTVGNYFYRQIGIIQNLTYKISNDTPWEIAIDEPEGGTSAAKQLYELPHIIDVSLTFIPIGLQNNGNNQIPQIGTNSPVILQGDTNPWVSGSIIGEGAGIAAVVDGKPTPYNANYVGSDLEAIIKAASLPLKV